MTQLLFAGFVHKESKVLLPLYFQIQRIYK